MKKLIISTVLILTFCVLIGCGEKENNLTVSQYEEFAQIAKQLEKVKSPDFIETERGLSVVNDDIRDEGVWVTYFNDCIGASYKINPKDVIRIISSDSHEEWRRAAFDKLTQ